MWLDRPADVGLDQVEHLGRRGGEALHAQLVVQEHRRDLRALEQVLQVGVGPPARSTRCASSPLTVFSSSLTRLQLLLRGLQLLVGGCSSSLSDWYSSFEDLSSSFVLSSSSIVACSRSRVRRSSASSRCTCSSRGGAGARRLCSPSQEPAVLEQHDEAARRRPAGVLERLDDDVDDRRLAVRRPIGRSVDSTRSRSRARPCASAARRSRRRSRWTRFRRFRLARAAGGLEVTARPAGEMQHLEIVRRRST